MPAHVPRLPNPRGPISEAIVGALSGEPASVCLPPLDGVDALTDDDLQLALWSCYELHYASFGDVDDAWEWEPGLLGARRELERVFVERIIDRVGAPVSVSPGSVGPALLGLAHGGGPSLSGFMVERATHMQLREFLVHRSVYQRKEADPHTWVIPRVRGRAKAALVAIQYDEYGSGTPAAMHAELFATTMRAADLDPEFGAYVDLLPGSTLATDNLVSMFGLHRRWRAACVGHLALFEMTSVGPMGRYSKALRRLGLGRDARKFYDVHVTADAVHQHIALDEMVGGLVADDPAAAGSIVFGAHALATVEAEFSGHLLDAWQCGESSLLAPPATDRIAS